MSEFAPAFAPKKETLVPVDQAIEMAYASKSAHNMAAELRGRATEAYDINSREAIVNKKTAGLMDGFGASQENAASHNFLNPESTVDVPVLTSDIIRRRKEIARSAVAEAFRHAA